MLTAIVPFALAIAGGASELPDRVLMKWLGLSTLPTRWAATSLMIAAMTLGIDGVNAFATRMSRNEAWNNAGSSARSALAAVLGYFFGLQYVAITILLSSMASAFVVTRIKAAHIDDIAARSGETSDEPAWRALLRLRGLLLLAATVLIYQAASSAMLPYLAEARTAAGNDPSITTGVMCVISRGFMVPAALLAPAAAILMACHRTNCRTTPRLASSPPSWGVTGSYLDLRMTL